jgi:hypothetical protein
MFSKLIFDSLQLHKAFKIMGIDLELDEIEYIFNQIDDDGSGEISFEEFASYVCNFDENDEKKKRELEKKGGKQESGVPSPGGSEEKLDNDDTEKK